MRSNQRDGAPAGVLDRTVALLGAFTPDDGELSLAELARRSQLARSTTHRLCGELVRYSLFERTPNGYRLGLRLFELGQLGPRQRALREAAAPVLAELHAATRETVHLAVLDGLEVVYIEILYNPKGPNLASRVGGRLPAYATAVGKAILAFSPSQTVAAVIAAGFSRRTPYTMTTPGRLRQELCTIAQRGIAFDREESGLGVVCAASPVFGEDDVVLAALSVSGRSGRMDLDGVATSVCTAALLLSSQFSHVRQANPEVPKKASTLE